MKAKEYYAKYKDRIASVDDKESLQGVCDMLHEFCMESKEMVAKRKSERTAAPSLFCVS